MTDIIKGVSYLNSTIETNPSIIKKNKHTILHQICQENNGLPEGIPVQRSKKQTDLKQTSHKNKNSTSTSTECALQ